MTKCLNHDQCGNKAKPPHALCQSCQDFVKRLTAPRRSHRKQAAIHQTAAGATD
jgi:hypothetical protein